MTWTFTYFFLEVVSCISVHSQRGKYTFLSLGLAGGVGRCWNKQANFRCIHTWNICIFTSMDVFPTQLTWPLNLMSCSGLKLILHISTKQKINLSSNHTQNFLYYNWKISLEILANSTTFPFLFFFLVFKTKITFLTYKRNLCIFWKTADNAKNIKNKMESCKTLPLKEYYNKYVSWNTAF